MRRFSGMRPFKDNSLSDLFNLLAVSKACSHPWLVKNMNPMVQSSMRIFGSGPILKIIARTAGKVFSAGSTSEEVLKTLQILEKQSFNAIIDFCGEGAEAESNALENEIGVSTAIDYASTYTNNSVAIKLSALMDVHVLTKLNTLQEMNQSGSGQSLFLSRYQNNIFSPQNPQYFLNEDFLSEDEKRLALNALERSHRIVQKAVENNVLVMVDAEQTYFQSAIDSFTVYMQERYNQDQAVIYNTIQSYLRSSNDHSLAYIDYMKSQDRAFGVKLVRGAYMSEERPLATNLGKSDPIWGTKQETDESYDRNVVALLNSIAFGDKVTIATHNEASVNLAKQLIDTNAIDKQGGVKFAQLLGMRAGMSRSLSDSNYQVSKYVPFGPVDKMIPYLLRRAAESFEVVSKIQEQIVQIWDELKIRAHVNKKGKN